MKYIYSYHIQPPFQLQLVLSPLVTVCTVCVHVREKESCFFISYPLTSLACYPFCPAAIMPFQHTRGEKVKQNLHNWFYDWKSLTNQIALH